MTKTKEEVIKALSDMQDKFQQAMDAMENEQEDYWKSLSHEEQLQAFCAVCRRIRKGDLQDRGSYRYVLYDVFGWGPEAYAPAQLAGYLDIHNALFDSEYEEELLANERTLIIEELEKAGLKEAAIFVKGLHNEL